MMPTRAGIGPSSARRTTEHLPHTNVAGTLARMPERFDAELLDRLRDAREVQIETSRGPGTPVHRTVIWVVVDGDGRVLIRSYRGASARWFRETLGNPAVTLVPGDEKIPATAQVASDAGRIAAASLEYREKYRRATGLNGMLADDVLSTTLELIPR
jgi:hypothetical protein